MSAPSDPPPPDAPKPDDPKPLSHTPLVKIGAVVLTVGWAALEAWRASWIWLVIALIAVIFAAVNLVASDD